MNMFLDEVQGDESSLKDCVAKLRELSFNVMMAKEALEEAEKAYSEYAIKYLPERFSAAGVSSMQCEDGKKLVLTTQARASITKDGKQNVANWLREHQAGDLVTANLVVPETYREQLRAANVAFDENVDMNTNKVKSLIKEMLETGAVSQGDLPKGLSWYQWNEVVVK